MITIMVLAEEVSPRLSYTIDQMNKNPIAEINGIKLVLNGEGGDIQLGYHSEKDCTFNVPPQKLLFKENYEGTLYLNQFGSVYGVELVQREEEKFCEEGRLTFDIFETIFFHLSRYEELLIKQTDYLRDKLDFEQQLLAVANEVEKQPLVDELVYAFLQEVSGLSLEYPQPKSLSHDIDFIQVFKNRFSIVRKLLGHVRHRKPISSLSLLWDQYQGYVQDGNDPFDTFDWMLSKREMEKTIYFLVGGEHREDNKYRLDHPIFLRALKIAQNRNYTIGIHPSYESWNNLEMMKAQKEKLETVVGIEIEVSRQHFLNFDIEITPRLLQELGIQEDSSLGYARHTGYRCGTGFPFQLYDFENEKAFDVVEKPLVFMDSAWYFEAKREEEFDPNLEAYYGCFNFHNSFFSELRMHKMSIDREYLRTFILG